jgi:cell fate (sporulation/competence/biofilm development) regulator YlbF (YheA/YmcA/DUF963 family)
MNTSPTLPPDVLAAIEALAENLLHSEPLVLYHQARTQLEADRQTRDLLERFAAAQADLRVRQTRGQVTQAAVEELRALQIQVQANRVIMDYAATQQMAIAYLPEVNQEISELLGVDFASLAGPASC